MLDPILPALKDRMEVLELRLHRRRKTHDCKTVPYPYERNEHGLNEDLIEFQDDALKVVIKSHTRESGVRNLERDCNNL